MECQWLTGLSAGNGLALNWLALARYLPEKYFFSWIIGGKCCPATYEHLSWWLACWHPVSSVVTPVDISQQWKDDLLSSSEASSVLVSDCKIGEPYLRFAAFGWTFCFLSDFWVHTAHSLHTATMSLQWLVCLGRHVLWNHSCTKCI